MKLILISDTHGYHHDLHLPEGDILLHAGDVSKRGFEVEVLDFLDWFAAQPHPHKIFIAGNHDFFFERKSSEYLISKIPHNIHYLNDSGVEIEGLHIWGSPIQPWYHDWAFNRQRGTEIRKHWELIPKNTDILITHGPPKGILDKTINNELVGCADLLEIVQKIQPKLHLFGHIHEAYGHIEQNHTHYINASVLNLHYQLVNKVVEWEL